MDLNLLMDGLQIFKENINLKRFAVLITYLILMKLADLFIDRILRKLASRTKITFDDYLINFLHGPICWTLFWVGVLHVLALESFGPPWQALAISVVYTMLLVVWVITLTRIFNWAAGRKITDHPEQGKVGKDVLLLLKNVIRVVILASGVIWLLAIWKVDLTPMFASAGIAGIAIALAAKDTLANFFGGISIFMDKNYKLGDYIIIESGERGEVVEIGIRSTRMKTRDDVMITIPNSIIANSKIINESAPVPRFRIRIPVGVAYGSDIEKVEEVLLKVAADNPGVAEDPAPRVRMRAFADSSLNFELLCWVENPASKGFETHNLLRAIYHSFAENKIVIPFPQRDVHLMKSPE